MNHPVPALRLRRGGGLALACLLLPSLALGQFAERRSLVGSGQPDVDASGRSVKNHRVRAIHEPDSQVPGGTGYFFEKDPFLAYQLGRNLNFREFRDRDGIFSANGTSSLGGPMPDGTTAKITAQNQVSCSGCHNLPYGNAGGGVNFAKDAGVGRNTPHYYGAGIVEMLALQVRAQILETVDTNKDGWISGPESVAAPPRMLVKPSSEGRAVAYGDCRLDGGTTGSPRLNNIFRVWYVDAQGREVPGATSVDGVTTHGYNFAMIVWGWGQGKGRSALNPTNRAFLWDPWVAHGGLDAHDPSTSDDPEQDGVSRPTMAGAIQFPVSHRAPDAGTNLDPLGFSLDDPDGDGYLTEISEGDLDLAEWFMLNAPRPAFKGTDAEFRAGRELMREMACTSCHTPSWDIAEKDDTHDGDRRFFDLDVRWNEDAGRLEGRVERLFKMSGDSYLRRYEGFKVRDFFSDLAHHEMGPGFEELGYDGVKNSTWRTPPLWGVGSGFPWGHDGASLTLEDVILRHGGEASGSRQIFEAAKPAERAQLLDFLSKMVLYDVESLPTDVDGDGQISPAFQVAGRNTGEERFNPEWLFRVPVAIQGDVTNAEGQTIRSFAATNIPDAYGENLTLRRDSDLDGWPDVWDRSPSTVGYRSGDQ